MTLQPSVLSPQPSEVAPTVSVRVTGGRFNGFEGVVAKTCESVASIWVAFEGKTHELVVDIAHLTPLATWRASKSATELQLRGAS